MPENFPPANFIPVDSSVSGIDVYMPAPVETGPQQEVVDFKCPQCGATTAFSAAEGGLTCTHCGYYEAPQIAAVGRGAAEFEFTVETVERAAQGWGQERKEVACQNCGALTSVPADTLTQTCPFCGSNKVIQRAAPQDILRPRFLIPFKVDLAGCLNIVQEWLSSSWMTPPGLKRAADQSKFTGIYLPFWTFDAVTQADWKAEVAHTETERYYDNGEWKTRTKTVWRWESGHVQLRIDDLVVPGTTKVSKLLLSQINDFHMDGLCPYESKYLPGFQAQAYDVTLEQSWEEGRRQMREKTRAACLAQASNSQVRNFHMNLDFSDERWRYILLPVYLTSYSYENKAFQILINGQTGTISGQRPVDWTKVWLAVAALLAPGLLLGLIGIFTVVFGGVGVPISVVGFGLFVIGLVIAIVILRKAQGLDDA